MSFGKDSSLKVVMQDGVLVYVGRSDVTADKQPLDSVEEEVWRIFGEHKVLKASHKKLVTALARYGGHEPCCMKGDVCNCGLRQALKDAEKL